MYVGSWCGSAYFVPKGWTESPQQLHRPLLSILECDKFFLVHNIAGRGKRGITHRVQKCGHTVQIMLTDKQFALQQTSDVTAKRALATRPETFPTCWDFTCWCVRLTTTSNVTFYKHGGDAYSARAHRTPPGSRIWNNNKQWNLECLFIIIYVKLPTMRFPPVVLLPSVSSKQSKQRDSSIMW